MMTAGVNNRSAATKRLMKEYAELQSSPNYQYSAAPLEDNIFDWHFTIRGPQDSEFENGIYHGRIVLPPQYPYKPPSIYFLTPNGRFELGKKICLSITGYHPETWLPAWGIRTALIALISFMTTEGKDAVGALDYTPEERRILAKKSHSWHCQQCGCKNCEQLLPIPKKEEIKKDDGDDNSKLAEMLVVSHDKKDNNNDNSNEQEKSSNTTEKTTTTTPIDVNNTNNNIPASNPNSDNNVINQSPDVSKITPISSTPSINHNTNAVEVNASSIQQRVPASSSSSSIDNSSQESLKQQQTNTTTTTTTTTTTNTTNNITQMDPNLRREERYKSLIDTLIIIVFSLLAFLLYYRSTKDTKFWNDME